MGLIDKNVYREFRIFTVRLFPNTIQREQIETTLNGCDSIWNYVYDTVIAPNLKDKTLTAPHDIVDKNSIRRSITQLKALDPNFDYLNHIDRTAINAHIHRLTEAFYNHWYKPKFYGMPKRKDLDENIRSYTTTVTSIDKIGHCPSIEIDVLNNKLKLPILGWVNYASGPIPYVDFQIMSVTIKSVHKKKYYGYLNLRIFDIKRYPMIFFKDKVPNDVGIDLGIINYATFSTGEKIANPTILKNLKEKRNETTENMNMALDKYGKESNEFKNYTLQLNRVDEHIKSIRREFQINLSNYILNKFDIVFLERFRTVESIKKTKVSNIKSAYYDAAFYSFTENLIGIASRMNKAVYIVPETYGSSTHCHVCGTKYDQFDINGIGTTREWTCPHCGTYHDRDVNAAINILFNGRWMLNAPYIAQYQDQNGIPRPAYPICNNGLPNMINISKNRKI